MENIRKDFNAKRNQQIFEDYQSGEHSYSTLAQKYKLTSQRVQSIVKDYELKGLSDKLSTSDTKEKRELFKKQAELLREKGNLSLSEQLFLQVKGWDISNENTSGLIDVLGHLRIVYALLSKDQKDTKAKKLFLEKAEQAVTEALEIAAKSPKVIDNGRKSILNVHLASVLLDKAGLLKTLDREELEKALGLVEFSVKHLAGSRAHKAWAKRLKGEILAHLDRKEEALDTLLDAEKDLFLGYKEEIKTDAKNEFKIGVWLTGIQLTLAQLALEMGLPLLARHYASSVLAVPDPTSTLGERKKQAKKLLEKTGNS